MNSMMVVENTLSHGLAFDHGSKQDVRGVSLSPKGYRGYKVLLDGSIWDSSPVLRRLSRQGKVKVIRGVSDEELDHDDYWPSESELPSNRHLRQAVIDFVVGDDKQRAEHFLTLNPVNNVAGTNRTDRAYVRDQYLPALRSARDWLSKIENPTPEQKRRLRAVKKRIREVEQSL